MRVFCARCGGPYENPFALSQKWADDRLEICDPCDLEVYDEVHDELRSRNTPDAPWGAGPIGKEAAK